MVSSTSMKYARALAEVAAESGITQEVQDGLEAFREMFRAQPELQEVLYSPTVPLEVKRNIVRAVARKMGLSEILLNFLFVILERSRLHLLDEFTDAYQEVLDEAAGIARVEVLSSHPLKPEELDRLRQTMSAVTGRTVKLSCEVDETLIGGVRVQVGSTVYDGTVQTHLEELRRKLASASV